MSHPDIPRLPRTAKAYIHKLDERVAADAQLIAERDAKMDELTRRLDVGATFVRSSQKLRVSRG